LAEDRDRDSEAFENEAHPLAVLPGYPVRDRIDDPTVATQWADRAQPESLAETIVKPTDRGLGVLS
jgi:hypothetical protein